ncbi:MAG: RDD family protein [Candidatus Dormibacteria bacterium]
MTSPHSPIPPNLSSWLPWTSRHKIRASDAEREQTVTQLTEHHLQGRLSSEELGDRSQLAYRATTAGELNDLLSDLPGRPGGSMLVWEGLRSLRTASPFPGLGYVGFWPRTAALFADILLLGAVAYFAGTQLGGLSAVGLFTVVGIAYFVVLWATTGRTVGLWLAGGRVVRQEDGHRLGLRRSLIRMVGYFFDVVTLGAGFAWAAVDRRRQGWHDKMAGSYVVRKLS